MNKKPRIIALFGAAFLLLNGVLALLYVLLLGPGTQQTETVVAVDEQAQQQALETQEQAFNDRYYSVHFNEGDAIDLCEQETRSRNNNIIQLSVDKLSTRYVDADNNYLVKLNSFVGTPLLYDEKAHECRVDPATDGVAFYREIMKRRAVRPGS